MIREDKDVSLSSFGSYLSTLMEQRGVSNKELADAIPIDPAQITRMRKGQQGASMETLVAIAHFFKIRPGILLDVYDELPEAEIKDQEAQMIAERIISLSPRARRHIENQLELLSLIRFEAEAALAEEITPEQARQAEATLERYRNQLKQERAQAEEKERKRENEHWQWPEGGEENKNN